MRLTTYLSRASRDRVALAALERGCTIRHILELAVASYMAEQKIDPNTLVPPSTYAEDRMMRTAVRNCVKITTIISDETRASLKLLKRLRGYSISHTLDRAIQWYLWQSPDKLEPRRAFDEAFNPRLDIPVKTLVALPSGIPSLYDIRPGSSVLIDSSIVMLAVDSKRVGYFLPRSAQCEYLVMEAKNGRIQGYITPLIMADLWRALCDAFTLKVEEPPVGSLPGSDFAIDDMSRRLQAFCGGAIKTLPILPTDIDKALRLAKQAPIPAEVALSLAAMHRAVGPAFLFATANPDSAEAAAALGGIHVPTDLDKVAAVGEVTSFVSAPRGRGRPANQAKLPLTFMEAGSD
jgi:hypothetical protein